MGVAAGGLLELIDSGKNGYLVSNDDAFAEFSRRVTELLSDAEKRRLMGKEARRWAEVNYF